MTAPLTFPPAQGAKNRLLITLVLDTSESMAHGGAITDLNRALKEWRDDLRSRDNLRRMGEIALVTFGDGGVRVVDPAGLSRNVDSQPFIGVDGFNPPDLRAAGFSPMVAAIRRALAIMDGRLAGLSNEGIGMAYRPLIYLITDGAPTDENGQTLDSWRDLAPELHRREQTQGDGRILFTCFAVRGADRAVLKTMAPNSLYDLGAASFSNVLNRVLHSIETAITARGNEPAQVIHERIKKANKDLSALESWFRDQDP